MTDKELEEFDAASAEREKELAELLGEVDAITLEFEEIDPSEFEDLPRSPFEGLDIEQALNDANKRAEKDPEGLLEEFQERFAKSGELTIEDLFAGADTGGKDAQEELGKRFALLLAMPQAALAKDCDCSKELAALKAAQAKLKRAQAAFALVQANRIAATNDRKKAVVVERTAWLAYRAAQRNTAKVCGGIIGRFDPLCLVAIAYEALLGNKWRQRQIELRNVIDAEREAIRLERIAKRDLVRAERAFQTALMNYFLCLIRCLFGF